MFTGEWQGPRPVVRKKGPCSDPLPRLAAGNLFLNREERSMGLTFCRGGMWGGVDPKLSPKSEARQAGVFFYAT